MRRTLRGALRRGAAQPLRALYVHLSADGGIFVVRGWDGTQQWITEAELQAEVGHVRAIGGELLLTHAPSKGKLPPYVEATARSLSSAGLPVTLAREPHPDAVKPLDGGATALIAAALMGHNSLAIELADRGVPLDDRDDHGYSALMCAANRNNSEIVDLLISRGADVNARDRDGSTPIMFAAQHGFDQVVSALLAAGADVNARGTHGLTALGFANQHGLTSTIALLESVGGRA